MTIPSETLTAIKRAYQIWDESRGEDVSHLMDLMADDIQLTTLADGTSPLDFSRPCNNKEELAQYIGGLLGDWDLLSAKIEDVICERDCAVILLETSWRNRRTDKRFTSPAAHVWRLRHGKAINVRLFFDAARWGKAASND